LPQDLPPRLRRRPTAPEIPAGRLPPQPQRRCAPPVARRLPPPLYASTGRHGFEAGETVAARKLLDRRVGPAYPCGETASRRSRV